MMRGLWRSFVPFLLWWPDVDRGTLKADALAALTGAVVVLPQGVAFATIAGMPPEYGLYAAMVPAIVAALFGSSRQLVSGPTTAASIVLFSSLSALAVPGSAAYVQYALTLTFMVGAIQLVMGLARLGTLVNFVSHSVIVGFTSGAAVLIAASQLKNFLGVQMPGGLRFHEILAHLWQLLGDIDPDSIVVGLATLAVGIALRRYWPRFPYMIGALLAGSLLGGIIEFFTYAGFLHPVSGESGLRLVGAVPATLPPLSAPDFSLHAFTQLGPIALAVTLFALTEAVSISRSLAARTGELVDGNQEFVGQGLSNIVGSFFSAYVATGSFNRSAVNAESGARTPVAAILAGVLLVGLVLAVAPLLAYLPMPAMAAILFLVAWGIVDVHHIRTIVRASASDAAVLWATFAATLLFPLDFAIILGVFLSLIIYLRQASRPSVAVRVPDPREPRRRFSTSAALPQCPQLALVRIDGALFFGAVTYVAERLRLIAKRNPLQKHLLLLVRSVSYLDVAGAEMLAREARMRRAAGGQVYFHQVKEGPMEILRRGGYLDEIGEENLFLSKAEAIGGVFERLDRSICLRCDARIFNECRSLPKLEEGGVEPARDG